MPNDEIVNVRYMVSDVEESIDFYTTLLDFEVLTSARRRSPTSSGATCACCSPVPRARPVGRCPTARRPAREAGTGSTSSSTTSTPRSHGCATPARAFRNDIVEGPGGKQILLQDPSGNVVELFQPAAR